MFGVLPASCTLRDSERRMTGGQLEATNRDSISKRSVSIAAVRKL